MLIEIGSLVINTDHVTHFRRTNLGGVVFYLDVTDGDQAESVVLRGDEAQAFKEVWDNNLIVGLHVYKVC